MIDYIEVFIEYPHNIRVSTKVKGKLLHAKVESMYRKNIIYAGHIYSGLKISFCPGKYLQGHNIFFHRAASGIIPTTILDILSKAGIQVPRHMVFKIINGDIELRQIDLNFYLQFASRRQLEEYMRYFFDSLSSTNRAAVSLRYRSSVYIGKENTDNILRRIYDKRAQALLGRTKGPAVSKDIKKNKSAFQQLLGFTDGKLRYETSFRHRWLKNHNKQRLRDWFDESECTRLLEKEYRKTRFPKNLRLGSGRCLQNLTKWERRIYRTWLDGSWDAIAEDYSIPQQRRIRNHFLNEHQIDLQWTSPSGLVPVEELDSLDFLDSPSFENQIPAWAFGTELLYASRNTASTHVRLVRPHSRIHSVADFRNVSTRLQPNQDGVVPFFCFASTS